MAGNAEVIDLIYSLILLHLVSSRNVTIFWVFFRLVTKTSLDTLQMRAI